MKVYKILDNVYVFEDITKCCSNVIIGDKKALVFDTGTGVENLYDEIKNITDLDLIVINSHGHFDHIGGNYLFDSIYIHPLDYYLPNSFYNIIQTRKIMIKYCDLKNIKDIKPHLHRVRH
ncbi:MAG: MBL fold metallo-hydrolase [Erysipelotrichaceae bacterium]|nr:MBL fold metallo-hydrolase [Erysipelotrichaceae bacterium]